VRPGDVANTFTETYNEVERSSNEVVTHTPEHPAIDVEKFDTASGAHDGDRDTASDALTLNGDTELSFTLTNTGDVPLDTLAITDKTVKGIGVVSTITCPGDLADTVLQVGQSITCTATLTGVQAGTSHTDTAIATAQSVFTTTQVSDQDSWNATSPQADSGNGGSNAGAGGNLAVTGFQAATLAVIALLLGAVGITTTTIRAKKNQNA